MLLQRFQMLIIQIPGISDTSVGWNSILIGNDKLWYSLTGSMSAGFTIGFIKG